MRCHGKTIQFSMAYGCHAKQFMLKTLICYNFSLNTPMANLVFNVIKVFALV